MFKRRRIQLSGCTALVTGASAGIGQCVARRLAKAGANLVIAARRPEHLEIVATSLRALRVRALAVPTDVAREDQLAALVDRAIAEFGRIDVLVNNAGLGSFCHFELMPTEQIVENVRVNLTSALVLTRLVVPHMLAARRGHIVNMASTAGKFGPPYGAAYATTKAGLITFTQAIRAEFRGRGVSASAICPGFTDDGGIYDRMKARSGRHAPWLVGSTTVDHVADAVIRAVERDLPEIIVNWPPMRPAIAFTEMFPSIGGTITRAVSVRFLKRVADAKPE
jgi:short-subunit dehydrogenase